MERLLNFLLLFGIIDSFFSCRRNNDEKIVDCFGESILVSIKSYTDENKTKKVFYIVNYSGSKIINSVNWDFGDGVEKTTLLNSVTHIYSTTNNFNVKAHVQINNGEYTITASKMIKIA